MYKGGILCYRFGYMANKSTVIINVSVFRCLRNGTFEWI